MKYYVYISDTKVDMLLAQIPHDTKKKIASEYKVDLKIISANRKSEVESEDNRYIRLNTVCEFIRDYGNVGTVNEPSEYIADTLNMRWGPFGDKDPTKAPLVYFGGGRSGAVIGLGGSIKHVIGAPGQSEPTSHPIRGSVGPVLVHYLKREFGLDTRDSLTDWEKEEERLWPLFVFHTTLQMRGPIQRLEFMAKRLLEEPLPYDKQWYVLLGTPLYVAMID